MLLNLVFEFSVCSDAINGFWFIFLLVFGTVKNNRKQYCVGVLHPLLIFINFAKGQQVFCDSYVHSCCKFIQFFKCFKNRSERLCKNAHICC